MKKLILISGASGSGKDTLKTFLEKELGYINLISTTTREKRKNEINGIHYNFITIKDFENLINQDLLLEYSYYNDNYYGKEKEYILDLFSQNVNIVTILEKEGIFNILKHKEWTKENNYKIITIFLDIKAETIKERMLERGDSIDIINKRLQNNDFEYFQDIKQVADIVISTDNKSPYNVFIETQNKIKDLHIN